MQTRASNPDSLRLVMDTLVIPTWIWNLCKVPLHLGEVIIHIWNIMPDVEVLKFPSREGASSLQGEKLQPKI